MINQVRRLFHFHHERTHVILHVIIGTQTRKNAIANANGSKAAGYIASNLCKDCDQRHLLDVHRLCSVKQAQ